MIVGRTLFDSALGIDLPAAQRGCGYIFQDLRLFLHMSVADNLGYGQKQHIVQPIMSNVYPDMDELVKTLAIRHLLNRYPLSLSGGEAQRVAIGRAIHFLLMDSRCRQSTKRAARTYWRCLPTFTSGRACRSFMSAITRRNWNISKVP